MAAVSIDQGMPGPEESAHKVDRSRWQLLAMARRRWAEIDLPFDCRLLRTVVDEAPMLAEGLGMESGDRFLTDYLSLDLDLVGRVLGWLEQEQPTEAVPLAVAAATCALNLTGTFAEAGDNQHTLKDGGLDNIKTTAQGEGGTSAAYLAARLKKAGRDDLLEQDRTPLPAAWARRRYRTTGQDCWYGSWVQSLSRAPDGSTSRMAARKTCHVSRIWALVQLLYPRPRSFTPMLYQSRSFRSRSSCAADFRPDFMPAVCQLTEASRRHLSTSATVTDPSGSGLSWPALINWETRAGEIPSASAACFLSMAAVVKARGEF